MKEYVTTADALFFHKLLIERYERRAFDMEHLVPWLQGIVEPPDPA